MSPDVVLCFGSGAVGDTEMEVSSLCEDDGCEDDGDEGVAERGVGTGDGGVLLRCRCD